jgi:hypothetical protein
MILVQCRNCGARHDAIIPRGQLLNSVKCERCDCKALDRGHNRTRWDDVGTAYDVEAAQWVKT